MQISFLVVGSYCSLPLVIHFKTLPFVFSSSIPSIANQAEFGIQVDKLMDAVEDAARIQLTVYQSDGKVYFLCSGRYH